MEELSLAPNKPVEPLQISTTASGELVALPPDWSLKSLNHLLAEPRRKKGTVALRDIDSFFFYLQEQGIKGRTRIYIDADFETNILNIAAVLNDHSDLHAGWMDHRAVYTPRSDLAWKRWMKNNGTKMKQHELANFLEQNIADIHPGTDQSLPTGADVLGFVSQLSETRKIKYTSGINTQNGMVQLEFIEEGDEGQKGKLDAFRQFGLGIRVFENDDAYALKAFLRYRIDRQNGEISFWYELQSPEKVFESATTELLAKVKARAADYPVLLGKILSRGEEHNEI